MLRKTALVTGGLGDIGLACAKRLAAGGMNVVLNDIRDPSEGNRAADQIWESGGHARYLRADVANRGQVESMMDRLFVEFGGLDLCLSNAGIVTNTAFLELTDAQWTSVLSVNLTGGFNVGQSAARRMIAQKNLGKVNGKIIFTGSFAQDVPHAFHAHYCASKGGLLMLAKTMVLELAPHGITVNLVAPGFVDGGLGRQSLTEKPHLRPHYANAVPLGELQTPQQVADVVEFLASDKADYLTGTTIRCDGGCSLFNFGMA